MKEKEEDEENKIRKFAESKDDKQINLFSSSSSFSPPLPLPSS